MTGRRCYFVKGNFGIFGSQYREGACCISRAASRWFEKGQGLDFWHHLSKWDVPPVDFSDDSVKTSILIFPEVLIQNCVLSSLQTISWEFDFVVTFDTALAALWSLSRSPWPFSCQPCGFFLPKMGCVLEPALWIGLTGRGGHGDV